MNFKSIIKKSLSRVAAFFGFFVDYYHDGYVYVPVKQTRKGKLVNFLENEAKVKLPLSSLNTLGEDHFNALANQVIADGRTFLAHDRLYILWQAVRNVYSLQLPSAEVGSYRGGSAFFLARAFKEFLGRELPLHVIDTFEGHPDKITQEFDNQHAEGYFSDTSVEAVQDYLSCFSKVIVHKGEFTSVVKDISINKYGFVHIDVDIYQSILDCLNYFGKRIAEGGVIVVDDYGTVSCPGVERAVKEYLSQNEGFMAWQPFTEQIILIKSL